MCYKGYCFHVVPIERGALALAIITTGLTGLTLLASIVAAILLFGTIVFFAFKYQDLLADHTEFNEAVVSVFKSEVGAFIGIVFAASLVAFVFSVLFLNGVSNRRPIHVLIYLFYGVFVALSSTVASVVHMSRNGDHVPGIVGFFVSVVYSLCLVMVYQTYVKLREDEKIREEVPLVEN